MTASIGDRMKFYERQATSQMLLPQIPACARIDGRAFHSFTRGLARPYDQRLSRLMQETTRTLVRETNANCGYTQSDEINLVWYSREFRSEIFFRGRAFKMTSILAAMTTAYFNARLPESLPEKTGTPALFDARVWNVPVPEEAANYFLWRELDATRNSISMAAQALYSHEELLGKSTSEMQELLWRKGVNWNDYPAFFKRGTYFQKRTVRTPFTPDELESLPPLHQARRDPNLQVERQQVIQLDLPPLSRIRNRADVILSGAAPLVGEEAAADQSQ